MSTRKKEKKKDNFQPSSSSENLPQTMVIPSIASKVSIEKSPTVVTTPPVASTSSPVPCVEVEKYPTKPTSQLSPPCLSSIDTKGVKRSLIGYVHSVSPVKRNKRNTVDYFEIALQTENCDNLKTLCYEKSKRALFQAREESKTPVKLTNFTTSQKGDAVFVNSMTCVTQPQQGEYSFQYKAINHSSQVEFVSLKQVKDNCVPMEVVSVKAKVLRKRPEKIVGKNNFRLAEAVIADGATTLQLDIWEDKIPLIEEGKVYSFNGLRVREWRKELKLSASTEAKISLLKQDEIVGNHLDFEAKETDINDFKENTLKVRSIISIKSMNPFIQCVNCNKKIVQDQGESVVCCDNCGHHMNRANCKTNIAANIIVSVDNQDSDLESEPLRLTAFQDVLMKMCPEATDYTNMDYLSKLLLSLQNFKLQYNSSNVITAFEFAEDNKN